MCRDKIEKKMCVNKIKVERGGMLMFEANERRGLISHQHKHRPFYILLLGMSFFNGFSIAYTFTSKLNYYFI